MKDQLILEKVKKLQPAQQDEVLDLLSFWRKSTNQGPAQSLEVAKALFR